MGKEINFKQERYFNNIHSVFESLLSVESQKTTGSKKEKEKFIKNEEADVRSAISNIETTITHAIAQLSQFYIVKPELRKDGYEYLINSMSKIKELLSKNNVSLLAERQKWISIIEDEINRIFIQENVESNPPLKLKINAPANVIYDVIKQLMQNDISIQKGLPILSQTRDQIALFIKENIEGFEKASVSTIVREISRDQFIKKSRIKIDVLN